MELNVRALPLTSLLLAVGTSSPAHTAQIHYAQFTGNYLSALGPPDLRATVGVYSSFDPEVGLIYCGRDSERSDSYGGLDFEGMRSTGAADCGPPDAAGAGLSVNLSPLGPEGFTFRSSATAQSTSDQFGSLAWFYGDIDFYVTEPTTLVIDYYSVRDWELIGDDGGEGGVSVYSHVDLWYCSLPCYSWESYPDVPLNFSINQSGLNQSATVTLDEGVFYTLFFGNHASAARAPDGSRTGRSDVTLNVSVVPIPNSVPVLAAALILTARRFGRRTRRV